MAGGRAARTRRTPYKGTLLPSVRPAYRGCKRSSGAPWWGSTGLASIGVEIAAEADFLALDTALVACSSQNLTSTA
jgi:hypothetical protein